MSYTTTEYLRLHLVTPHPIEDRITEQRLTLSALDPVRFYGGAVDETSIRVKAVLSHQPVRRSVTLDSGPVVLAAAPLVPDSVVVASDSSLGTIYTENVDYILSCSDATLRRLPDGHLTAGQTITVWYLAYTVMTGGEDYVLNCHTSDLRRLSGGRIPDGATVYLDYSPLSTAFDDRLLDYAVTLANGLIETELDPAKQFETDPNLAAAATHRALEIVSRAAAARELSSRQADDKAALAWMKLADHHAARAEYLVRQFRPPFANPQGPAVTRRRTV